MQLLREEGGSVIDLEPRSASGLNATASPLSSSPTRFHSIFSNDFDPVIGVYSLAISDVGTDDFDLIESLSIELELDLLGCLDSGL